jgi:hypothetical protein
LKKSWSGRRSRFWCLLLLRIKNVQTLLDFLFFTNVGRVSRVLERADSDHEELVMGGCKSWCFLADFVCFGEEGSQLCFCFLVLQEKRGENMLGIRHGRKRRNAIWLQTNKLRKNAHTWMPTGEAYSVNSERSEVTATRSWVRIKPQHQIQYSHVLY